MSERKNYKKPPAVEALFETYFSETQSNLTLFGDFYQRIKNDYPTQKELKNVGFEMNFTHEIVQTKQLNQGAMMRFSREDDSELVQITQNLLTVNKLKPYSGYDVFKNSIQKALEHYLILSKPKYVERIGLRYINRISIPEKNFILEDYFNFSINFSKENEGFSSISGILFKVQLTPKNESHKLFITLSSIPSADEGKSEFILDIYDIFILQKEVSRDFILSVLDEAHRNVEYIFEGVITDSTRNIFEETK